MKRFNNIFFLVVSACHWLAPSVPPSTAQEARLATCQYAAPSMTCPYTFTHGYLKTPTGRRYYWSEVDMMTDAEAVGAAMCCAPSVVQSIQPWGSVITSVVGPDASGHGCVIEFATTDQHRDGLQPGMKRCTVPIPWRHPPEWLYARQVPVDFAELPADCEDIPSSATISEAVSMKYVPPVPDTSDCCGPP